MMKKYAHKCLAVLIAVALVLSVAPTALAVDASFEEKPLTEEELAAIQTTNEAVEGYINSLYAEMISRKPTPIYKSVCLEIEPLKQTESYYCGPASALMVALYLKIVASNYSQKQMADKIGTTPKGSSSAELVTALNSLLSDANRTQRYQVATGSSA